MVFRWAQIHCRLIKSNNEETIVQKPEISFQHWIARFQAEDSIDMLAVTGALAAALTKEASEVSESTLNAIWQSLVEPEDFEYLVERNGHPVVGIPLVYLRYADFSIAVGSALGFCKEDDDFADMWITDVMPETLAIFTAVRKITIGYLSKASGRFEQTHGYTPADAWVKSIETGEPYEQSSARLHHEAKGLRTANSDPQENEDVQVDWEARLAKSGWLSLTKTAFALEHALGKEVCKVDAYQIMGNLVARCFNAGDDAYLRDVGELLIGYPALIKHYAGWVKDISKLVGIDSSSCELADDWVTDAMPETRAIFRQITSSMGEFLAEVGPGIWRDDVCSSADALFSSLKTGEPFDQTRIRLGHASKGLRAIDKHPKK